MSHPRSDKRELKEDNYHYLVADYDNTLYQPGEREDGLSSAFICYIKDQGIEYNGFYGCTHRFYKTIDLVPFSYVTSLPYTSWQKIKTNSSTVAITKNFEKAAQLKCIKVSMASDILPGNRLGQTYEQFIQLYETTGQMSSFKQTHFLFNQRYHFLNSKNQQLMQIAEDVALMHPDKPSVLDFYDDKQIVCKNASQAAKQPGWPVSVTIRVHFVKKNQIVRFNESKNQTRSPIKHYQKDLNSSKTNAASFFLKNRLSVHNDALLITPSFCIILFNFLNKMVLSLGILAGFCMIHMNQNLPQNIFSRYQR